MTLSRNTWIAIGVLMVVAAIVAKVWSPRAAVARAALTNPARYHEKYVARPVAPGEMTERKHASSWSCWRRPKPPSRRRAPSAGAVTRLKRRAPSAGAVTA